jgi:hypothetical protein
MGSTSFIESFVAKVFHEDLGMISNHLVLADPPVAFAMLLLCYAECYDYLLCIMFQLLGILQHCIKFDIRTTTILEKLLGAKSFGGFINHLARCQGIFFFLQMGLTSFL